MYALLVLKSGLFHLLGVFIATSNVLHSSTDLMIARWFRQPKQTDRSDSG